MLNCSSSTLGIWKMLSWSVQQKIRKISAITINNLLEIVQIPQIQYFTNRCSSVLYKNHIDWKHGCMLLCLPENTYFINFKQLQLEISRLEWSSEGDYIKIQGDILDVLFYPDRQHKTWKVYENLKIKNVLEPTIFLH